MEPKSLLLVNVSLILLISYSTDHWLLHRIRDGGKPPGGCRMHQVASTGFLICSNSTHILLEQRSSLFRQCNDLTNGPRRNASRHGLLYGSPCHWFLFIPSSPFTPFTPHWKSVICAITATIAILTLGYSNVLSRWDRPDAVSKSLLLTTGFYAIAILLQLHIMHGINVEPARNEADSFRYCEAGWSLGSGVVGSLLSGICAYLYWIQAKIRRDRLRSQRRRRQMHNAIMSSCRQEIALAIRAKMTVL